MAELPYVVTEDSDTLPDLLLGVYLTFDEAAKAAGPFSPDRSHPKPYTWMHVVQMDGEREVARWDFDSATQEWVGKPVRA